MANETRLNQIVKGAPTANIQPAPPPPLPSLAAASNPEKYSPDPHLQSLPSSPPQIYLNLLILEASLRSQYLHLLSRRRLNTFFLLLLALWNSFFFYALFLRPREDGTGLGGSVYWVVETSEKLALMGGTVTGLLVWATGQWERGVRWPRRWLGTTNRGLRVFNLRVVIVRRQWYREMPGHMSFLLPFGLWTEAGGSDWHHVEHENGSIVEEDLAKGGDHIMLLLLPKSFSPEFRENWEEYRSEYWEKENERRTILRRKLRFQRRVRAREIGGWKWWTGLWRLAPHRRRSADLEKQHLHQHGHRATHPAEKDAKSSRRRSLLRSDSQHSRQSSRSSTPVTLEFSADGSTERHGEPPRIRRGSSSTSSSTTGKRKPIIRADRKILNAASDALPSLTPLTMAEEKPRRKKERDRDRPGTPGSDVSSTSTLGRNGSVA